MQRGIDALIPEPLKDAEEITEKTSLSKALRCASGKTAQIVLLRRLTRRPQGTADREEQKGVILQGSGRAEEDQKKKSSSRNVHHRQPGEDRIMR